MEWKKQWGPRVALSWMFGSEPGVRGVLVGRWFFLRALGLIYFSAFYSLAFQIKGLMGPQGLLPAGDYLQRVALVYPGLMRFWYAPTVLWMRSGDHALMALCWVGMVAALLVTANVAPRWTLVVCFVCYLSFTAAAQDFSGYQSDGMLLVAGFLALFFAPRGWWPGWGARSLPSRASWLLLLYEWFRIYFESGIGKLLSGDKTWRSLTAMYEYYQNGPLPTWVGWYAQHLPLWFQRETALLTLVMEVGLVWFALLGRRIRQALFVVVTVWQAGVILTANYTFLNYLVLVLAFLLLDDALLLRWVPVRWRGALSGEVAAEERKTPVEETTHVAKGEGHVIPTSKHRAPGFMAAIKVAVAAVLLTWMAYVTTAEMVRMFWRMEPVSAMAVGGLAPFRIANQYGLFESMTAHRYEVEFQGSDDGQTWTAYPFRYKPQDVMKRPGIYAPYQPRFDWNLWFASLGSWRQNEFVPNAEEALLVNQSQVLGLFAGNPFASHPPKYVRAVLWQYWFTTTDMHRLTGTWWRREMIGTYAPTLYMEDGKVEIEAMPELR